MDDMQSTTNYNQNDSQNGLSHNILQNY